MHDNSLDAFDQFEPRLTTRSALILAHLRKIEKGSTDRDVKTALGFTDMNQVRPRISELIKKGLVEECGSVICPVTEARVRLVRAVRKQEQGSLF